MDNPLISVIITVYNTRPYLEKCFDSVFSQNSDNLEIIIVNDGSTDDSLFFCEQYTKEYNNVTIIDKKNGGASDARNAGLLKANGDYIHFIDSDDYLINDRLYQEVAHIIGEYSPDIIFSLYKGYNKVDNAQEEVQPLYQNDGYFRGDILQNVLKNQYIMTLTCPVNKLFKREFLIGNDLLFTPGLDHEEDEWLPRVIACAKDCYFFNTYIYGVRCEREGSLSETKNDDVRARKARSKMKIAATGIEYMKQKKLDPITLQYVAGYYWEYMISAVVNTQNLKDDDLQKQNYDYIEKNKSFFKNYKLLRNRHWRVMGWLFTHLGVKFTAKLVAKRYGKQR